MVTNTDLELALDLADEADDITMRGFQSETLGVRTKGDQTPVSEADEATERMIRDRLLNERPGDAVIGEEFGTRGTSARRWIIDPIDATKNYIRGVPVFATLIALEEEERMIVGVISAPALARRWWAVAGEGAFCNGNPIRVSRVAEIERAHIGYDSITDFDPFQLSDRFLELTRRCGRSRAFGDFWIHMLVAEGAMDIAVEPRVALWDMAPIQIIVEEAGGHFTDLKGNATANGGSALSTNGLLHEKALRALR